jgi:exopolysaccharide biosynthesis polyprenyl glycosylphosphotransferase
MGERKSRILYIFSDIIMSMAAWLLFFFFRKIVVEEEVFGEELIVAADKNLIIGLLLVPLFWFILNYITGYYKSPLRRSRLKDLGETLLTSLVGTIFLFFLLILDDIIPRYNTYYLLAGVLFSLQFLLTYICRFIITSRIVYLIQRGKIGFRTLLIGSNGKARNIYSRITSEKRPSGNIFAGYISLNENGSEGFEGLLPNLGSVDNLGEIVDSMKIEEVIIAIESSERQIINDIVTTLSVKDVLIKIIPDIQDILMGRVRLSAIFGTPLILVNEIPIPAWQANIKQLMDYSLSIFALLISLPLSLFLAFLIRIESKGSVIFSQDRVGRNGKHFKIYKFRSMYADAEKESPMLSSDNDPRITRVGRVIRRHRLDEIPNFINVLKGEMSIIGPRPEREYYINKIVVTAPHYLHLLRVKPGITSWGQVKYGYASDVEQMIERLEYDLLYLENMSLYVDLKIAIYTLITIVRGRGV